MARVDPNQALMPTILDRLIDPDSGGTIARHGYGVEQMFFVVQRDLEDLLNTRQTHVGLPEAFDEVHRSIVAYGLPELTSLDAITPSQRDDIGRVLEGIVKQFEPRLKDVHAELVSGGDGKERSVKFRINARLCLDPAPEVAFDTVLELATGHYRVQPSSS
jgi:type VI secretion system protein ImpF